MKAGHQDAAGRCTNGATAVVTGESHALIGERINVWCSEPALSKAGKVAVAKVIREDNHNVGARLRKGSECCGRCWLTTVHGQWCQESHCEKRKFKKMGAHVAYTAEECGRLWFCRHP